MSPEKPSKKSFADAHNEWVERHGMPRNRPWWARALSPGKHVPTRNLVIGLILRSFVLVFVAITFYHFSLRSHLRSEDFVEGLAEESRELFNATSLHLSPLTWKGAEALVGLIDAQGADSSFYRRLQAEGITFEVPWRMRFRKSWDLKTVAVRSLEIEMRSGAAQVLEPKTGEEGAKPDSGQATPPVRTGGMPPPHPRRLLVAGLGVNPSPLQFTFDAIEVEKGTIRWGAGPDTAGSIRDSRMRFTRGDGPGGSWEIEVESGFLSQNWIRNLEITTLKLIYEDGQLRIPAGEATVGETGRATLSGSVLMGAVPQFDLRVRLTDADFSLLADEEFSKHFDTKMSGDLALTGSPNTADGIGIAGSLTFAGGGVRDLNLQATLTAIYADPRFRRLRITTGKAQVQSQRGKFDLRDFQLVFGDFAQAAGDLSLDRETQQFTGRLAFGVSAPALAKYPLITQELFQRELDGLRWAAIPVNEPLKALTRDFSNTIAARAREIDDAGKKRR